MTGLLVTSGCITPSGAVLNPFLPDLNLDYIPKNDIVAVKLRPDATMEWVQVLDSVGDDREYWLMETPDNNLLIYASLKK